MIRFRDYMDGIDSDTPDIDLSDLPDLQSAEIDGYRNIFAHRSKLHGPAKLLEMYSKVLGPMSDISEQPPPSRKGRQSGLDSWIENLSRDNVGAEFFSKLISYLDNETEVSLRDVSIQQRYILEKNSDPAFQSLLLEELHKKKHLAPIPEIFWKVDRTPSEYNTRFGFDVKKALEDFSTKGSDKVLLEFGAGSGVFRENFSQNEYINIALSDKQYYSLASVIQKSVDFDLLEQVIGTHLSEEDRATIADILYKILVIKEGDTSNIDFAYDQQIIDMISNDPNRLIDLLKSKLPALVTTESVPSSIHDVYRDGPQKGQAFYEDQIRFTDLNEQVQSALQLLSRDSTCVPALPESESVYSRIAAFTPGTMIGDFDSIKNVEDNSVYVGLAVRSTVYKKGQEYTDFLSAMTEKIEDQGIFIDDSVRENFGAGYRLPELLSVQNSTGYPIHVIVGPGVKDEDFIEGQPVPLALVMSRSESKLQYIQDNLDLGYELHTVDSLIENQKIRDSQRVMGDALSGLTSTTA